MAVHSQTSVESGKDVYYFLSCNKVSHIEREGAPGVDTSPREPKFLDQDDKMMNNNDTESMTEKMGGKEDDATTTGSANDPTTSMADANDHMGGGELVTEAHVNDTDLTTSTPVETTTAGDAASTSIDDHHRPQLQGASLVPLPSREKGGKNQGTKGSHTDAYPGGDRHPVPHNETTKVNMYEQEHVLIHDWLMALLICFAILLLIMLFAIIIMCSRMSFTVTKQKVIDEYNVDDGRPDFDYYNSYPAREIKY